MIYKKIPVIKKYIKNTPFCTLVIKKQTYKILHNNYIVLRQRIELMGKVVKVGEAKSKQILILNKRNQLQIQMLLEKFK